MSKTHIFVTCLSIILVSSTFSFSQPDIDWSLTLENQGIHVVYDLKVCPNGDFIVSSECQHIIDNHGYQKAGLTRINSEGEIVWARNRFDQDLTSSFAHCVVNSPDGGFLAGGSHSIMFFNPVNGRWEHLPSDVYILKIDAGGNLEWTEIYEIENTREVCIDIKVYPDGEYVLLCRHGNSDFLMFRINNIGEIIWEVDFENDDELNIWPRALEIVNNNIYAAGDLDGRFALICFNGQGEPLWNSLYGDVACFCTDIIYCRDGGLALTGTIQNENNDLNYFLIRINEEGDELWNQIYEVEDVAQPLSWLERSVVQLPDLGFTLVDSRGNLCFETVIIRTDRNGEELWQRFDRWGGNEILNSFHAVQVAHNGSIVAAGMSLANGLVVKYEPDLIIRHFDEFVETEFIHQLNITQIEIDGEPIAEGWEVGVLTPDEILAGGAINLQHMECNIIAYGDDPETEPIEGFNEGERFQFIIWDDIEDIECEMIAIIEDGPEVWTPDGETVLTLEDLPERINVIDLVEGWNVISLNIIPGLEFFNNENDPGPDVILMTEQLRIDEDSHHLLLMKDGTGRFYLPEPWQFCNIPFWNLTDGYMMKVDEETHAEWSGETIDAQEDIPLNLGWNMIAYYPDYELSMEAPDFYGISPIIDNVILMKDNSGNFALPDMDFSNMTPLRPTQGYLIKVNREIILNYPMQREDQIAQNNLNNENHALKDILKSTGKNMSILVDLSGLREVKIGNRVKAYSTSNTLVGVGIIDESLLCGLAIWGNDPTTDRVDGLVENEVFYLKLWMIDIEDEVELHADSIRYGNGLVYKPDEFIVLDVTTETVIPDAFYLAQNYPNPFNSTTRIEFGTPETGGVSVSVYDLNGRLVKDLIHEVLNAGEHFVLWESLNISTGIYLVQMESSDFKAVRKVIVTR